MSCHLGLLKGFDVLARKRELRHKPWINAAGQRKEVAVCVIPEIRRIQDMLPRHFRVYTAILCAILLNPSAQEFVRLRISKSLQLAQEAAAIAGAKAARSREAVANLSVGRAKIEICFRTAALESPVLELDC